MNGFVLQLLTLEYILLYNHYYKINPVFDGL